MSQYYPTRSGRADQVRIGDAERDRAVSMLSEHFVAGRLTQEEFEERGDQATRARYAGDLVPLFADLPDLDDRRGNRPPEFPVGSPRFGPPPLFFLAPVLMVGVVVAAVLLTAPWILWMVFWIALFSGVNHHRRHHRYEHRYQYQHRH